MSSTIFTYDERRIHGPDFTSNSIDALYYNRADNRLGVEFQNGSTVYVYENVPESVFNLFVEADSLNAFYRQYIQGRFGESSSYHAVTKRAEVNHADADAWENQPEPLADWERELLEGPGEEEVAIPDNAYSQYVVNWTGSFNSSDERMGPFSYATEATSESAAIENFQTTARNLHGDAVTAKIVSVTHYFE
jgi:hypothetical protein